MKIKNAILSHRILNWTFQFIWVTVMIWVALPKGLNSLIGSINLPLNSSPEDIRAAWGQGDAGSLLDVAITWAKFDSLDPNTQIWIVHLWSPGFSLIETVGIWVLNIFSIPIYWTLLVLTVIVWLCVGQLIWNLSKSIRFKVFGSLFFTIYLFSWDFKYIIRDDIFYTEGIGYGLLLLGLGQMASSLSSSSKIPIRQVFKTGTLVGLSVWVRHVSDSGLILLFIIAALYVATRPSSQVNLSSKILSPKKMNSKSFDSSVKTVLIFAFVALLTTLPWRIISTSIYQGNPLAMSSAQAGVGQGLWIDAKQHPTYFWIPYNMNWACDVDPDKCIKINNSVEPISNRERVKEAVYSAINNPISYVKVRGEYLLRNWIPEFNTSASLFSRSLSLIPILTIPFSVYLYSKLKIRKKRFIALIWVPFLSTQIGQLLIIHFEPRYFIPVRYFLIFIFLHLINLNFQEGKEVTIK